MLLNEKIRYEKATYYMIPIIWLPRKKAKLIETVKDQWLSRAWESVEKKMNEASTSSDFSEKNRCKKIIIMPNV